MLFAGNALCGDVSVVMVGNRVVMESDIRAKMREEDRNYDEALRELVTETLFLLQAEKEGIAATEAETTSEINRIMKNFPDEKAFMAQLEKENMPYRLFKARVEDKIKARKLIRKNIIEKIKITAPEVAAKMKELEGGAGNNSYNITMKWFDDEPSASAFVKEFSAEKEQEMGDVGWLEREKLLPEVLEVLEKTGKGQLSAPVKVGDRYLVALLKDVREQKADLYSLYARARNTIYNEKFAKEFDAYLRELQAKTPIFYAE
jgi:parvulin-like peptidyl-prolyl isomerase